MEVKQVVAALGLCVVLAGCATDIPLGESMKVMEKTSKSVTVGYYPDMAKLSEVYAVVKAECGKLGKEAVMNKAWSERGINLRLYDCR